MTCHKTRRVTHPSLVQLVPPQEVQHPVAERLERVRGKPSPDGRDAAVEQGLGDIVQLTAHAHLAGQRLQVTSV